MSSEWTDRAACRTAPSEHSELAFGNADEQRRFIRTYCRECPVQRECYQFGRDEFGVFGGMTQKKRGNLLGRHRNRSKAAA